MQAGSSIGRDSWIEEGEMKRGMEGRREGKEEKREDEERVCDG